MQQEISFGEWLRKQRRALDLSRQAIADQVGCAEVTLRRIEGGTLRPSKELANLLLENLGIPEHERSKWFSFARGLSGFPSQSSPLLKRQKSNLPAQLTTFIGREKEQLDVIRLIAKYRLVTLTGSGGVGKTRLSLKMGEQVLGGYSDGVWLVELAPILDPVLVPRTTAIAVGLRDEPQRPVIDMLSDYLLKKQVLIILDNCEHLLEAGAQLADTLLKHCPHLKILATSREVLGILGEAVYRVPSLVLPDLQQSLDNLRGYESVRLFEERARLVQFDFSLASENAPAVAKICTRLDGVPLAIELAAARVSTFSAEEIEERLQESFSFLTSGNRTALPRHQTLRAAIDWSYDLLSPTEQTLFRRLAVFVNGWTLEAAESVCSDDNIKVEVVVDLLIQLRDKSLVVVEEKQNSTRYRMLETVRQYAAGKLFESGESDTLRDRHLEYFLNLAETAEPYITGPEQVEWLPLLDADYDNFRFALESSLSNDMAEPALNLCKALAWYWVIRCYWLEGMHWTIRALEKHAKQESKNEKIARARALCCLASLEAQLGNSSKQILAPAKLSLSLSLETSDKKDIAIARYYVGIGIAYGEEDDEQAIVLMEQSFAEFDELHEPFWQARVFLFLNVLFSKQGKRTFADLYKTGIELARKAGERLTLADALWMHAEWLLRNNRLNEARENAEESDRLYIMIGSENTSLNSSIFAEIAWLEGDTQKARSLYMELYERFSLLGDKWWMPVWSAYLGRLSMELGDLPEAQGYLEQALVDLREVGFQSFIAYRLAELSKLFYLQGNLKAFKQKLKESLSLRNYLAETRKPYILINVLDSLCSRQPKSLARLLGVIDHYEMEYGFPLKPIDKHDCMRAENYARKILGESAFEVAFAEGQKMSLDEGLDLALKAVEEM
jgi:predicted ATPase/DNA-binding XRE family transcriptional regulator